MKEEWARIPFCSGYEISNKGRVRSLKSGKPKILKQQEIKKPDRKKSYLRVTLRSGKRKKHRKVHHMVALQFVERVSGKNTVNHKNGNTHDNVYTNLEWTTNAENIQHAWDTGLMQYRRRGDGVRRVKRRRNRK